MKVTSLAVRFNPDSPVVTIALGNRRLFAVQETPVDGCVPFAQPGGIR